MKTLIAIVVLCLMACAHTHPIEAHLHEPDNVSYQVINGYNMPCTITCGRATCIAGYDTQSATLVHCMSQYSDSCICAR